MLNCTDLECILHHHHYYAHLHHLQRGTHHIQDDDNDGDDQVMSTEPDDVNDTIQSLLNDTDAPNDSVYMICGVLIAMFLVGIIIVLLAITISKLRKREEHSNSVHPTDVVLQTATNGTMQQSQEVPQLTLHALQPDQPLAYRGQFLWQYPPPPPQYNTLYSNDQDTLVQSLQSADRPGFVRGFRKNIGGRWRRLVKRKPETEVYTIPAELKPQLKQIYVY